MSDDGEEIEISYYANFRESLNTILTIPTRDENYIGIEYLAFIVMAVFELVIMLNLPIAIISDTYERV